MAEQVVREVLYSSAARKKLLEGVDAVANAVKVTMGAKGRTVVTSQGHTTKDGVTVARDIEILDDKAAAHGARLIKAASVKTCDVAGDGTTTVCVLAQAMIHEGMRVIEQGKDPQDLKREMEEVKPLIIDALKTQAKPITDVREIANVSANDTVLGGIVAEAVGAVGVDGLVTVENTYGATEVEIVEGMQVDRGATYPVFYTDSQRRRCSYDEMTVLMFKGKIHDLQGLAKLLEPLASAGKSILIIADDYEDTVMRMLALSRAQNGLRVLPIKSPAVYHDETLEDLAIYTGATLVTEADGFKNFKASWLGQVKSCVATGERTILRAMPERSEAIEARALAILEDAKQFRDAEKRNVEKRASRLKGKMAIVKMAATTEEEGKEQRDRVEDAIYASQAALEMGVVAGGGYALLRTSKVLSGLSEGSAVIGHALKSPMRQIVRNAGKNDSEIIRGALDNWLGYNVVTDQFEDLMATGIVDPLKVVLTAFENALSVAILALTTEVVIADKTIKE